MQNADFDCSLPVFCNVGVVKYVFPSVVRWSLQR